VAKTSDAYVSSLAKGLAVIRAFGEGSEELTLTQVAQRAGLSRSGARRLLLTLQQLGYVSASGRRFFLTPRVLELGYSYLSSLPLWRFAEPLLEDLVAALNETASVGVLDRTEVVYVLRIPAQRILRSGVSVGTRLPAHATSLGRILLGGLSAAELAQYFATATLERYTSRTVTDTERLRELIATDRARGWSYVSGELEEHIRGISMPIIAPDGRMIAAMNVSTNVARTREAEVLGRFLPALRTAVEKVSLALRVRRAAG